MYLKTFILKLKSVLKPNEVLFCDDVFNEICTIRDQVNEEAEKLRLVPKLDL